MYFFVPHPCAIPSFLPLSLKGDILKNGHDVLFHTVKVNGDQELSSSKKYLKSQYMVIFDIINTKHISSWTGQLV